MVTGLYGALAASASVFIGILTALLATNLSNLNAQRERIQRRIETIDAELRGLQERKSEFEDMTVGIEELRYPKEPTLPGRRQRLEDSNFVEFADVLTDIHSVGQHNELHRQWTQTKTEIRSLRQERKKLTNRYESLDPADLRDSLKATVVTIGLSVGIPLLAYGTVEILLSRQLPHGSSRSVGSISPEVSSSETPFELVRWPRCHAERYSN